MKATRLEYVEGFRTEVRNDRLVLISSAGNVIEGVPVQVVDDAQYPVDQVLLEVDESGALIRAMVGSLI